MLDQHHGVSAIARAAHLIRQTIYQIERDGRSGDGARDLG